MAEDCGPWLEKKLEIGKYSKPNKLCGLCEVRRPAVPPSLLSPPYPRPLNLRPPVTSRGGTSIGRRSCACSYTVLSDRP